MPGEVALLDMISYRNGKVYKLQTGDLNLVSPEYHCLAPSAVQWSFSMPGFYNHGHVKALTGVEFSKNPTLVSKLGA